jgi:hypothetical protein
VAAQHLHGHHLPDIAAQTYRELRDRVGERAQRAKAEVSARARDTQHRANLALGRESEREHPYDGQTACALGAMALGAGLVWMFDPRVGRSRRTWLRDKTMKWARNTGDLMNHSGRRVADHLRGTVAETRRKFRGEPVSDEKLVARVRSELGRVVHDMSTLQITASDGHVTIVGQCEPSQAREIVECTEQIIGVRSVDTQLSGAYNPTSTSPASP